MLSKQVSDEDRTVLAIFFCEPLPFTKWTDNNLNPLHAGNITKYLYSVWFIYNEMVVETFSPKKTRTRLYSFANVTAADDKVTQGAGASATIAVHLNVLDNSGHSSIKVHTCTYRCVST